MLRVKSKSDIAPRRLARFEPMRLPHDEPVAKRPLRSAGEREPFTDHSPAGHKTVTTGKLHWAVAGSPSPTGGSLMFRNLYGRYS